MKKNLNSKILDSINSYTYQEVMDIICKHGEQLKRNLPQKAKCMVSCTKGMDTAIAIISCWYANLIPIPVSHQYGFSKENAIYCLTSPDAVITNTKNEIKAIKTYCMETQLFTEGNLTINIEPELVDVVAIMCTSGTTGKTKGVMLTADGLKYNVKAIAKYFMVDEHDSILIARPLYHCAVLTGEVLLALYKGLDIVFYDGSYNPLLISQEMRKRKITTLCGTPTSFMHLARVWRCEQEQIQLKFVISGECLTSGVARKLYQTFPNAIFYSVYGMTEMSPRISYLPPSYFNVYYGSVGLPLEGVKIRVTNIKNIEEDLSVGSRGMIVVKSPGLMKGYYHDPNLTASIIRDGWLITGDIGYFNSVGMLYVLARAGNMIIKAGMNIYPAEIENAVISLDEVKQCVVYGIKRAYSQDIGINIVLEERSMMISKKELLRLLAKKLERYQMPSEINIVEKLFTNASGKVSRAADHEGLV